MRSRQTITLILMAMAATWLVPFPAQAKRQYAPKAKRFMQRDPLGPSSGFGPGAGYYDGMNKYEYTGGASIRHNDPFGLCKCTVQVKGSGLHLYVHFEKSGCGSDDETGDAHWGPCGFIGMCPRGSVDGQPHPPDHNNSWAGGWGDDGDTPNGGAGPQEHDLRCKEEDDCDPCACVKDIMDAKYPTYLLLGPNSNSAAMEAAEKCGVNESGITGYPGQGISPGDPVDGGLDKDHGCGSSGGGT